MIQENAQEIAQAYIDPDRFEASCRRLEDDINHLVNQRVASEAAKWEHLVNNLEQKIASMKKRAGIVQLAARRHLKRAY